MEQRKKHTILGTASMQTNLFTVAIIAATAAAVLTGCAGRTPAPVSAVRAGDEQLTCAQIDGEANDFIPKVRKLSNDADKAGYNAGIAAVGTIVFLPALFALDLSDAEKIEIQAYVARYQTLAAKRKTQNCAGTIPVLVDSDGKPLAPVS